MSNKQQFMTNIENHDDFSMRNPNFIMDFPENAIFKKNKEEIKKNDSSWTKFNNSCVGMEAAAMHTPCPNRVAHMHQLRLWAVRAQHDLIRGERRGGRRVSFS